MSGEVSWPDIGQFQRRVIIKQWTDTADTGFSITQSMDTGIKRWAKLDPVTGVAYWNGKQIGEEITHKIWLRWGTGTKPEDLGGQHVVDYPQGNRRFRIVRATNAGDQQKFTMLECKDIGPIV